MDDFFDEMHNPSPDMQQRRKFRHGLAAISPDAVLTLGQDRTYYGFSMVPGYVGNDKRISYHYGEDGRDLLQNVPQREGGFAPDLPPMAEKEDTMSVDVKEEAKRLLSIVQDTKTMTEVALEAAMFYGYYMPKTINNEILVETLEQTAEMHKAAKPLWEEITPSKGAVVCWALLTLITKYQDSPAEVREYFQKNVLPGLSVKENVDQL